MIKLLAMFAAVAGFAMAQQACEETKGTWTGDACACMEGDVGEDGRCPPTADVSDGSDGGNQ